MLDVVLIEVLIGKGQMRVGRRKDPCKDADRDVYRKGQDVYRRMRGA